MSTSKEIYVLCIVIGCSCHQNSAFYPLVKIGNKSTIWAMSHLSLTKFYYMTLKAVICVSIHVFSIPCQTSGCISTIHKSSAFVLTKCALTTMLHSTCYYVSYVLMNTHLSFLHSSTLVGFIDLVNKTINNNSLPPLFIVNSVGPL